MGARKSKAKQPAKLDKLKAIVQLLMISISHGRAELNAKAKVGWTPLHMAKQTGYKDVSELLRQHGGRE